MKINKIQSVSIYVENQENALTFWTEKLGFEVLKNESMGPSRWIEVSPKGGETSLVIYDRKMMPNYNELKPSIVFSCDDALKAYEELKKVGVNVEGEPQKMPFGTFVKFKDDDNNEFLLVSK